MEVTLNLYTFIVEEFQCEYKGCKYNDFGFCECEDSNHLRDIIIKSIPFITEYDASVKYICTMAKPKGGLCLCGKDINNWKMDGFEHDFGVEIYKGNCDCGE